MNMSATPAYKDSWSAQFVQIVSNLDPSCAFVLGEGGELAMLNEGGRLGLWRSKFYGSFGVDVPVPRAADEHLGKMAAYHYWFADPLPADGFSIWLRLAYLD